MQLFPEFLRSAERRMLRDLERLQEYYGAIAREIDTGAKKRLGGDGEREKAAGRMEAARPYAAKMYELVGTLAPVMQDADHPLLTPRPLKTMGVVVIAGDKGQRLTFDEPNDGVVAVSETRLTGMKEHLVLPRTHTFLMNAPEVPARCAAFLKSGRF